MNWFNLNHFVNKMFPRIYALNTNLIDINLKQVIVVIQYFNQFK